MKKILITGAGSYVGMSFENWIKQYGDYSVDTVDTIDSGWKNRDFSQYDVVFHVAGIAHIKETKDNSRLYYDVNYKMAVDMAKKAKESGIKQFIFMSTMSVYGLISGEITKQTPANPKSNYGKSKLMAEEEICKMADESFKICILRPPMVYGKGCKGNFNGIVKLVDKLPFFPSVKNLRSQIYIDNLSNFVKKAIDEELCGLFFPQNRHYMNTSDIAKWISEKKGKKIFESNFLGLCVKAVQPFFSAAKKAFSTLIYKDTEMFDFDYCTVSEEESVKRSV
ncbi:MAG: NAD-dependent epimerase/dehydratase family protein [Clostridia bacterium]|nr:NAD-dependent epimerase/dehydratase family protein [Clostridia bacterium]